MYQARDLPRPDPREPHLADVTPSVLAAMGASGFEPRIALPYQAAGACVLLVDGLGADLLDRYAVDAPVLAGLSRQTLQVGFPSTTAAGLAAVGTGCRSGEHGMVGMTFRLPEVGVINALRWRPHPWGADLREDVVPEVVQPRPTVFERAEAGGVQVSVISGAQFDGSGLTRAVLRGGRYRGVHALGDLAATVRSVLVDRGFCYAYHADLDLVGHVHGPGSDAWRMQLRQVDTLVESILDGMPPGGLLAVVADHGMVAVEESAVIDIDATESLTEGVAEIGGEVRARHLYVRDGALEDVLATWQEVVGERAWVTSGDDAVAAGWFGERVTDPVRARIGDVVVAARATAGFLRRSAEPVESSLIGQHGSLTDAEQKIPLLLGSR
ncbi:MULTISPECIES: alkaline phosphatase family protein [Mycobacteriaceae]|uniref:Alkaline phosphatase family protein n=1 Tax=Mycolicibacterium parafortuitum TaxID=39692 RepID=A0ACC6MML7_MYCPF|nr:MULTISPECIES: nucleotide pyrophosphatase/phosphodiesterase family protein [Mycobacteriaceae]MDZ5087846.1 alkaline phosphatase family protein [Mycolicibacterium parafortuitum]GFM19142.1 type I phosphodiesterase/nucleotide pyrophosphatase [Mycobacterium sp. PO1]GFM22512.1 type I phosphodiesterase/nucleotide pyrophosphatase [Mycobacterium sp. PO2]